MIWVHKDRADSFLTGALSPFVRFGLVLCWTMRFVHSMDRAM